MKCDRCPNEHAEPVLLEERDDDGHLVNVARLTLCPMCVAPIVQAMTMEEAL